MQTITSQGQPTTTVPYQRRDDLSVPRIEVRPPENCFVIRLDKKATPRLLGFCTQHGIKPELLIQAFAQSWLHDDLALNDRLNAEWAVSAARNLQSRKQASARVINPPQVNIAVELDQVASELMRARIAKDSAAQTIETEGRDPNDIASAAVVFLLDDGDDCVPSRERLEEATARRLELERKEAA